MRTRRNIVLWCNDESERSSLALVLWTRSYNVLGAITKYDGVDLALIIDDCTLETITMAKAIAELNPELKMLVVPYAHRKISPGLLYPPQAQVLPLKCNTETMLERIRITLARKRGPKHKEARMEEVWA